MPHADHLPAAVRVLQPDQPSRFAFSICTLMTRPDQYAQMVQSYRDAGFGEDCEYLCIDNFRLNRNRCRYPAPSTEKGQRNLANRCGRGCADAP